MTEFVVAKFGVSNFKAISKFTEIGFNPVTLLIGDKDSGKSSLLNALNTFVESKGPERYLDVQPFYFDNVGNFLNYANLKNKYTFNDPSIEYHFRIAQKPEAAERKEYANITNEEYDVSIKFGMDTERIRLKETTIKVVFENDNEIELLHFVREEKRNILKLNLLYILEVTKAKHSYFYTDIYESDSEKLIGDLVLHDIAKEIMELGYKGFTEDRRYENGVYFPKTLVGVIRYYKYYLSNIFYLKYREDVSTIQFKCAKKVIDNLYEFIKAKLSLITDAIDVIYIECAKIKVGKNVLPSKYFNGDIFKKKFIEYVENLKYDDNAFNILKRIVKDYEIAEDISIEGDYKTGYSIYITVGGIKVNLYGADLSIQHIIGTLLIILMYGKFNLCFKGDKMLKCYEPNYKPIFVENPECYLTEEHQIQLADILMNLSRELNTQIILETQSRVMIDRFKESGINNDVGLKVYYFRRNDMEPAENPDMIEFEGKFE